MALPTLNVGHDLDPNCLTLGWYSFKKKTTQQTTKRHAKFHSMERINIAFIRSHCRNGSFPNKNVFEKKGVQVLPICYRYIDILPGKKSLTLLHLKVFKT